MNRPATLSTLREINAATVLETIREHAPISRAEVARHAGMTKPTVGNALDLLLAAGLVRETVPPRTTHYGAVYFEPVTDLAGVLALDIGSRYVRGAMSDLTGRLLARHDARIANSSPKTILQAARKVRDQLIGDSDIELVVAGVPGVVDPGDGVVRQSNRPSLEGVPIRDELQGALGLSIEVENDINLAAIGEHAAGKGVGIEDFAFLSVGTGVGAGLVLGGRPHRGRRGAAGEIDEPTSGEAEASDSPSADALASWAAEWVRRDKTVLSLPIKAEEVFAAASDDPVAQRILEEESRRIARRIADIARVVDVELVVLGGGIGLASAGLLPGIRAEAGRLIRFVPDIEVSSLGDAPVLIGALSRAARLARIAVAKRRIASALAPERSTRASSTL